MNNEVHLEAQLTEADTSNTFYLNIRATLCKSKLLNLILDIVANASSIAPISNSNIDVELIEPTYYKPGIPIDIKVNN